MIDNYFSYYQEKEKYKSLKTHLSTLTNQKLKRTENSLNKMQTQIKREANCDKYRLYGDLIMANLYNLENYTDKIQVYDYENNKNIEIDLDKTKTLKENANKFYKLYNKGKTSKEKLMELREEFTQLKIYLEQIKYSISNSKTYEDLLEIKPELVEEKSNKNQVKSTEPEKIQKDNFTIYIYLKMRTYGFIQKIVQAHMFS